jgi:hypothetical protein
VGSDTAHIRSVGPLRVWRCTEAIDPKSGYAFRTIGNADGRCIEIASPVHQILMDRRMAREVALAVLDICGPAEELPTDLATADLVQVDYDALGVIIGFSPYVPDSGSLAEDRRDFVAKVRADKGLPPSSLFDLGASHA